MVGRKWRFLSAALGLLSFLAALPDARAAAWYAANTEKAMTPLASIPLGQNGETVFAADVDYNLYELWFQNGMWNSSQIYHQPDAGVFAASATYLQSAVSPLFNVYYVAHLDIDGRVRLTTWDFTNGWKTRLVDTTVAWNPSVTEQVATLMFQGNLHIFYPGGFPTDPYPVLKCAIYNGNSITTKTLDGVAQSPGKIASSMGQPAAVVAPDGLHVFYYDYWNWVLREAYSPDGVNWTRFLVIDGGPGEDAVGYFPAAIVYNNSTTWTINVFYTDMGSVALRTAQFVAGTWNIAGIWHYGMVDYISSFSGTKAALIHNGEMQVYYQAGAGQIRVAYGTGPGAFDTAALDGLGPGDIVNFSQQDQMGSSVTAIESNGAPSVFYLDTYTVDLRNAYWK
jgi:hypothetical protein